ncbi:Mismatch repair protein msh3 [Coemansia sp. BCRC 34301]|nr:Mismatch repair protein msh3 [Coemansia sp. BCRC 34301]
MGPTKKVQGTLSSFFKPRPAAVSALPVPVPAPVAEPPKSSAHRKSQPAEKSRKRRRVVDEDSSDDEANDDTGKEAATPQAKPTRSLSGFLHSGTGNAGHSAGLTLTKSVSDTANMVERLRMRIKESSALEISEETGPDESTQAPEPLDGLSTQQVTGSLDGTSIQLVQRRRGVKYTPLELQVLEAKEKHPDVLLAVEVGYKYRFFGEDARIASRVLGIMCTQANNFYNASIPTPRLMVHVRRLVHAGYKVGVVQQQETAALKAVSDNKNAPFTRQLAQVYTVGTLVEEVAEHSTDGGDQYLMCVVESPSHGKDKCVNLGIMAVQITSGNVVYDTFEDSFLRGALETRLTHLQPGELLIPPHLSCETLKALSAFAGHTISYDEPREPLLEHASRSAVRIAFADPDVADPSAARRYATDFYTSHGLNSHLSQVLGLPDSVVAALSMLIKYLEPFSLTRAVLGGGGCSLSKQLFTQFHTRSHMLLSATTLQTLNVFSVAGSVMGSSTEEAAVALKELLKPGARLGGCHSRYVQGGDGSLFNVMDHTRSQFGRRMLRRWVAHPLVSRSDLDERMDAVEYLKQVMDDASANRELTQARQTVASMHAKIGQLVDLERGICRIQYRQASPQELLRILRSLECAIALLPDGIEVTEPRLIAQVLSRDTWTSDLRLSIAEWKAQVDYKSARAGHKETLFTCGSLHDKIQQQHDRISAIEAELDASATTVAGQLGLTSLEFKSISGIDYLIDVKSAQAKHAPATWVKISSTKSNIRFHTPFIIESLAKRERCREALRQAALDAYNEFLGSISAKYGELRDLVSSLATLDALFSLAVLARTEGYCRPELVVNEGDSASVDLVDAVNPVLSQGIPSYVPNTLSLGGELSPRAMILTGPNAGGKSSLIRMVALISVMAQCGSYVPARRAQLSIIDAIHTRIGASDNLMAGESTFMVEMRETAELLRQITPKSLVIIDELGRGTSTHDGAAIAYAVLDHLADQQPLTFFITHYAHLVDAFAANARIRSCHMSYLEHQQPESANSITSVTFLYKLADGASADSFGLNVARMAGLPISLLLHARERALWMRTEMESKWAMKCARDLRCAVAPRLLK